MQEAAGEGTLEELKAEATEFYSYKRGLHDVLHKIRKGGYETGAEDKVKEYHGKVVETATLKTPKERAAARKAIPAPVIKPIITKKAEAKEKTTPIIGAGESKAEAPVGDRAEVKKTIDHIVDAVEMKAEKEKKSVDDRAEVKKSVDRIVDAVEWNSITLDNLEDDLDEMSKQIIEYSKTESKYDKIRQGLELIKQKHARGDLFTLDPQLLEEAKSLYKEVTKSTLAKSKKSPTTVLEALHDAMRPILVEKVRLEDYSDFMAKKKMKLESKTHKTASSKGSSKAGAT
jgi:hypothetical protein